MTAHILMARLAFILSHKKYFSFLLLWDTPLKYSIAIADIFNIIQYIEVFEIQLQVERRFNCLS